MLLKLLLISFLWSVCSALLCYSCSNLKSNELCFNVTKCTYHEKAPRNNGSSGNTFCARTCSDNLCNLYSCMGENATRPVRCLECDMTASPDECTTVKQCSANEVCFTQKFHTFGNIRYRMGCMNKQHCDTHPRTHVQTLVGRRATDDSDCDACCMQDHCNIDACSLNASTATYHLNSLSPNAVCNDKDVTLCATLGRLNSESCKDQFVVSNCPKSCDVCDHIGWSSWQPWGRCGTTCEHGTKTRTRQCIHRWQKANGLSCIGLPTDSSACYVSAHCPINGGLCYRTEKYNCEQIYNGITRNCETRQVVTSSCTCPSPKYGGRGC